MKAMDPCRAALDIMKSRVPHERAVAEYPDAFGPRCARKRFAYQSAALFIGHECDMRPLICADSRMVAAVEQALAGDTISRHRLRFCHAMACRARSQRTA